MGHCFHPILHLNSLTSFILMQLGRFFFPVWLFFFSVRNRNEEGRNIHQSLGLTAPFQRTGHDAREKQWILSRYWFPPERETLSQLDGGINIERRGIQRNLFNTDRMMKTVGATWVLDIHACVFWRGNLLTCAPKWRDSHTKWGNYHRIFEVNTDKRLQSMTSPL